ncbi:hypothetical protein D5086_011914 [Populus alba]|uniref:Uncharacterized protein n=1 Tax=Populus alba TaxID=43335 RepID=A0ACC4C2J6_POPAL
MNKISENILFSLRLTNLSAQQKKDEDMLVDEHVRCEKWMRDDNVDSKESKTASWFKRFIGREQKPEVTWPFPFCGGRIVYPDLACWCLMDTILLLGAACDLISISSGTKLITVCHHFKGFTLEDATGISNQRRRRCSFSFATSLPSSHPSFSPQRVLEMSEKWKSSSFTKESPSTFYWILSATNHFAERMAVRKTWMQSSVIKSSNVVARFVVALVTSPH